MESDRTYTISVQQALMFLLALLFSTYLRISFLFIYPFLVVALFYWFKWKLDWNAVYLLVFVLFCWLFSFRNGFHLKYNLVSLYYFLPFLLLLFAIPTKLATEKNYLKMLMDALTVIVIVNNIIGFAQYIRFPNDDSFSGLYGTFTVSQNGLAILNAILFFYHFSVYQYFRKRKNLLLSLFFLVSMVMGFYGAGLMVLIATMMLTFFRIRLRNIVQLAFLTVITLSLIMLIMKLISPATLEYNLAIIDKFLNATGSNAPRKLIAFQNYFNGYISNPLDLLFGSGPGTFNSRTAFMVGSPTYFNVDIIKSAAQPFYFREYAYTLWNASNTGPYDGFMNQPFSSVLSILGEYGVLFAAGVFYVQFNRFRNIVRSGYANAKQQGVQTELKMFKFCSIFALLLICIDNYMEYPEVIALLLVIVRLSHQNMKSAFNV